MVLGGGDKLCATGHSLEAAPLGNLVFDDRRRVTVKVNERKIREEIGNARNLSARRIVTVVSSSRSCRVGRFDAASGLSADQLQLVKVRPTNRKIAKRRAHRHQRRNGEGRELIQYLLRR